MAVLSLPTSLAMNEGQFVYALSVAIAKRPDTQGVALPPHSEVHPYMYVNAQAVQQAQNYKQQGHKQHNIQSNNTNNYMYNRQQQYHQQQKQKQNQQQQSQQFFNNQNQNQCDNENMANQYQNQAQNNFEGRVAYFREDVSLNQQFANQRIYNPSWFNSQKYNHKSYNHNGENFYYYMQQVLARYNLERYCNDMPAVQPFQFNQNIQPGYNPQLQYHNGQAMPARPDNMPVSAAHPHYRHQMQKLDRRFAEAVDMHQMMNENGGKQALNSKNGVEMLGNMVQANENSPNSQYYGANNGLYGYFDVFRKMVGSMMNNYNDMYAPGAMETDATAFRDPVFYQMISRMVNYFQNFKNHMMPYKEEQVNFQGVDVQSVDVDKMYTFFDHIEVDMYNAMSYQEGETAEQMNYHARQMRLNHQPFSYKMRVNSEQDADAVVRVFIGPQYDVQGHQYSMDEARKHFVQIDQFVTHLNKGQNQITRSSQQSTMFVQQQPNTRDLFSQAQQGHMQYNHSMQYHQQYMMPQHLMLPKGSHQGQQYMMAVTVHQHMPQAQAQGSEAQDDRAQGFPFDRQIHPEVAHRFYNATNIYFRSITVFHKDQNENIHHYH